PTDAAVALTAFRRGDALATGASGALAMPPAGSIHVTATEGATHVPVRVQVMPAGGQAIPGVPVGFGEMQIAGGRLHIAFAVTGDTTLTVPPGQWKVIVSRGYEYELVEQTVTVAAGATATVDAQLERSVATPNTQCGDF